LPELAVVKGAVMWRQNPSIIRSRKVDATYGTVCCQEFNPLKHDLQYHFCSEDNILYCDNIFTVFIEKGDATEINDVYTTTYTPRYSAQTVMNIPIYSIFSPGFPYTRDASGQLLYDIVGELIIDIPNPDNKPKSEREVEVSMSFSGTEIRAKAKYCITGEEVKTVCDFLTDKFTDEIFGHT
jgi:ankyrin